MLRRTLEKRLSPLVREGRLEPWSEDMIAPGENGFERLAAELERAQWALVLVSADFLAAKSYPRLLEKLLSAHKERGLLIALVLVRATESLGSELAGFKSFPENGRAVLSWEDQDEAWQEVARSLSALIVPKRERKRMAAIILLAAIGIAAGATGWRYRFIRESKSLQRQPQVHFPASRFFMGNTAAELAQAETACLSSVATTDAEKCRELVLREQPRRPAQVDAFSIDSYEVDNAEFAAWLRQRWLKPNGNEVREGGQLLVRINDAQRPDAIASGLQEQAGWVVARPGYEHVPVNWVTWTGADQFCRAHRQRLPREVEWEFAARGQTGRLYPYGSDEPRCDGVIFGRGPGGPCASLALAGLGRLGPVSRMPRAQDRTPEDVYDLAGNVAEWVEERFAAEGHFRVIRGGDFYGPRFLCRAAGRGRMEEDGVAANVGFRCASDQ